MSYEFGLNTDIFSTNIVNLCFVARVVVNVVGENMSSILFQRQKKILLILEISDTEINNAAEILTNAKQIVTIARRASEEIREQSTQIVDQENAADSKKLSIDVQRLIARTGQLMQSEKYLIIQTVTKYHFRHLLERVQHTLLTTFMPQNTSQTASTIHKQLNHINRTILTLTLFIFFFYCF
jgi:F0F1-type ATP synthase membrane subunit b/b'